MSIKIMIAEDQRIVREGLRAAGGRARGGDRGRSGGWATSVRALRAAAARCDADGFADAGDGWLRSHKTHQSY